MLIPTAPPLLDSDMAFSLFPSDSRIIVLADCHPDHSLTCTTFVIRVVLTTADSPQACYRAVEYAVAKGCLDASRSGPDEPT